MQINPRSWRTVKLYCVEAFPAAQCQTYIISLGVAEKEQLESAVPDPERPTIDEYEVDFLLDPELDALMEEL